jgi:hypothetical protein
MPNLSTGPCLEWHVFCSKSCRCLDRHVKHGSTPSNGVFLCSKPCLHHDATSSTKAYPNGCVFMLEVLLPHRRPRNYASNGVFLKESPPPLRTRKRTLWVCLSARSLDAHFEHESMPQQICFCVRCLSSSLSDMTTEKGLK